MHERVSPGVRPEAAVDPVVRDSRRMPDVAAGEGLPEADDIRADQIRREAVAGPPESRRDLIVNEDDSVLVAELAGPLEERDTVHLHAARALEERLDDHRAVLLPLLPEGILKRLNGHGNVGDVRVLRERAVEILVIAHGHRHEGVAVVGVLE